MLAGRPDSTARVERGGAVHVLRRARDDADATLLAVGGRRSSRFLGVVMGDTGTELLHDGACSVLVARPTLGRSWQPGSVVVGLDGSASALAALAATNELATRLGATVEVVSATGDGSARQDDAWADRVDNWDASHPVAALVERSRQGGPRRRRLARPARPSRARERQRADRTSGPVLRPRRVRGRVRGRTRTRRLSIRSLAGRSASWEQARAAPGPTCPLARRSGPRSEAARAHGEPRAR